MQKVISKRRLFMLLLLAIASAAAVAWLALGYTPNRPMAFEKNRWTKARNQGDERVLNRMSNDLILRNALIGETRKQVIDLLGEPEKYDNATDRQMFYLVREDWDAIDPVRLDHLLILLDPNGRVVEARIDVWRKP